MCCRPQTILFIVIGIMAVVCVAENQGHAVEPDDAPSSPKSASLASAHANTRATQTGADALCDSLTAVTKESGGRIFGLPPGIGANWREYRDSAELEKALGKSEVLQKATLWARKDGAAAVKAVEDPMSGDWSQAVDYCFRPDGSLARTESILITFDTLDEIKEGVERIRVRYFDLKGREVAHREDVKNLKSRQPAKRVFADQAEQVYRTVSDLPFATLLTSAQRSK
jgi:hypothetical protein